MTRAAFTLTGRELTIIAHLIAGAGTKEIAAELGIGQNAVLSNLRHVRERFQAANNEQLVAILFRRGIQQ